MLEYPIDGTQFDVKLNDADDDDYGIEEMAS